MTPKLHNMNGLGVWCFRIVVILCALCVPAIGWLTTQTVATARDVAVIEGNRYTAADRIRDELLDDGIHRELWKEIGGIKENLADRLARLEAKVDALLLEVQRLP